MVCQCATAAGDKIRPPGLTVLGPCPGQRHGHIDVAMDPVAASVLLQAGMTVSRRPMCLHSGLLPILPQEAQHLLGMLIQAIKGV